MSSTGQGSPILLSKLKKEFSPVKKSNHLPSLIRGNPGLPHPDQMEIGSSRMLLDSVMQDMNQLELLNLSSALRNCSYLRTRSSLKLSIFTVK